MEDKLIVTGLGKDLDGEYPCDVVALIVDEDSPEYLTFEEHHTVKRISGARGLEIQDAVTKGDFDVIFALALIVLNRNGKQPNEQLLRKARPRNLYFDVQEREEDEQIPPTSEPAASETTERAARNGGESSPTTSDSPESDPSPTGAPV